MKHSSAHNGKEGRSSTSTDSAHPGPARSASSSADGSAPAKPSSTAAPVAWTPSQFKPRTMAEARAASDQPAGTSANESNKQHNVREYTLGEEIFNSVTHGVGALLAIAAIPLCIIMAVNHGGGVNLAAAIIYSVTMLVEYLMSTLYHAIAVDKAKRVFKVLDHSAIYLFIAGSYTPYCLISLADNGGGILCAVVWGLAAVGVACEAFWVFRPRWVSAVLYLLLGWCVVWYLPPLIAILPAPGLWLLVAGGICYSIGCIFYVLKKIPYMHSIFHIWILAGSVCQFFSIFLYVL